MRIGCRHASVALVLAGAVLSAAAAEEAADPRRAMGWTVGSWEGVRRDGTSGEETSLRLRVDPILGGAGLVEHLEAAHEKTSYLGFSMSVYDEAAGHWERRYANTSGRIAVLVGEIDESGVVWRGAAPERSRESRMVSERVMATPQSGDSEVRDGWRRTMWVSEDGGGSWRVLWQDDLHRVTDEGGDGR